MGIETFNIDVGVGSAATTKYDVKTVAFGDGYQQRQPKGLVPILESWNVSKIGTKAEIDAIKAFLDRHGGAKAFYWRVTSSEPLKKYVASSFNRKPHGGSKWEISWTMTEVLA